LEGFLFEGTVNVAEESVKVFRAHQVIFRTAFIEGVLVKELVVASIVS